MNKFVGGRAGSSKNMFERVARAPCIHFHPYDISTPQNIGGYDKRYWKTSFARAQEIIAVEWHVPLLVHSGPK